MLPTSTTSRPGPQSSGAQPASRAASRDRLQTSLDLAFGSALAGLGLTTPVIAIASVRLEAPCCRDSVPRR